MSAFPARNPPARRRAVLARLAAAAATALSAGAARADDLVRRGRPMVFPRDHGAHLRSRTEWWYVTGWLGSEQAPSHGFQVTFFRSRNDRAQSLPGRLAPRHLLFAHAAITDLAAQRHHHDQRLARWNGEAGQDRFASASTTDTQVHIGPWSLQREGRGYRSRVASAAGDRWSFDLAFEPAQPPLLQGDAGFSRKGPEERQASHYYSVPRLEVRGELRLDGRRVTAGGRAWLDHEWSDEVLAPGAVGWDWLGFNLFDGSALTAFALRRSDGSVLWAGGSHRAADGATRIFGADELRWRSGRRWRSPATGASYPVEWQIDTPAGRFAVRSLLDAQELDGRGATGTVYWEGLSELLAPDGRRIGLGYLEMTGYAGSLRL